MGGTDSLFTLAVSGVVKLDREAANRWSRYDNNNPSKGKRVGGSFTDTGSAAWSSQGGEGLAAAGEARGSNGSLALLAR
jgi:hypothetical protein